MQLSIKNRGILSIFSFMQENRVYKLASWQNSKELHVPAKILLEFKLIQHSFPLPILNFFLELLFCYAVAMFLLSSILALGKSRSVNASSFFFFLNLKVVFKFLWWELLHKCKMNWDGYNGVGFFCFVLLSFLVAACRPEIWLIWLHGWHCPQLPDSGKYPHVVKAGYQAAVYACAPHRGQGFCMSGMSLLKTFLLCWPLNEHTFSLYLLWYPVTVRWILTDSVLICVF